MNDWVVEEPSVEEDLLNSRYIMLNQNGVNEVVELIKNKNKEIERLNKTLERVQQEYTDEYNLRHKLSFELSVEKDKVLELSHHLTMYSSEETMLKEIERLNNIIKEVREYVEKYEVINGYYDSNYDGENDIYSHALVKEDILEILDKVKR